GVPDVEDPDLPEDSLGVVPRLRRGKLDGQFGASAALESADADALLCEVGADRIAGALDLSLEGLVHVDAEHQMDAALQVQPQVDRLPWRVEVPRRHEDDDDDDPDAEPEVLAHQPTDSLSPVGVTMRPRALRSKSSRT